MTEQRVETLEEWLSKEPFTLTMSSSFFGWYAHLGVLRALLEAGIYPAKLTGSSAGAMVGALYCWHGADGLARILDKILSLRREDVLETAADILLQHGRLPAGILTPKRESELLEQLLPSTAKIEDCSIPLCISMFSTSSLSTRAFNKGNLRQAVLCSTAVPGLMEPQTFEKERGYFYDGGVADIAGLAGVHALEERVFYHHCTIAPMFTTGISKFPSDRATTLSIAGLPIMHPLNMHRGREAYYRALEATRRALKLPRSPIVGTTAAIEMRARL